MTELVAAIDQGTTSTRCALVDSAGAIVAMAQREHEQIYPEPGWVEHDADEVKRNVEAVITEALQARRDATIAAIGITNQRETTLLWSRETGKPVGNAIVWQDTRTVGLVRELGESEGADRFRATTGLPLSTYFSGPKILWLLDRDPELRRRAESGEIAFGTMDSWVAWNIAGEHVTDVTNASRTMLMDLRTLDWAPEQLEAFGVPAAMLPTIVPSSGVITDTNVADAPLAGILGDQQAALFGQTCFAAGEAKNTYGTGCFMLLHTGGDIVHSENGMLTTVAYQIGDEPAQYALEGSVAIAGAGVQWLRDNLGLIESAQQIESVAATVGDNGGVYFVPAFSGLYAPWWRDDARGIIAGLTRHANSGHLATAVLEATAYQTRDVFEAMASDAGSPLAELKVDGGMVVNDTLMQFQADMLDVPVVRPRVNEATVLGAAYAAGLAIGFWESTDELRSHWAVDRIFEPAMPEAEREAYYRDWLKAVSKSTGWAT